jgi:hypothetical protein
MPGAAAAASVVLAGLMAVALGLPPAGDGRFAARADAVCARTPEGASAGERQAGRTATVAALLLQVDLARRQVGELRRLPVARAEQPRKAELLASFTHVADVMEEYARATRRGDRETRRVLARPGGPAARAAQAARDAAAALGLRRCTAGGPDARKTTTAPPVEPGGAASDERGGR